MAEYVERSDVQNALHSAIIEWNKDCGIARMEYLRIRLNNIPAADVRPVARGKWKANGKFENCENCTLCGCAVLKAEYDPILRINGKYSYCPNCGAKMEVQDG